MKLEVGMYVRTNTMGIRTIKAIGQDYLLLDNSVTVPYDKNHPKISNNLIDLIEVGDYVNGERVGATRQGLYVGFDEMEEPFMLNDIKIYEILTHEQYEANAYIIKE